MGEVRTGRGRSSGGVSKGRGLRASGPQRLAGQGQATARFVQRIEGSEPPVRDAGDQDDAGRIDDIGRFARRTPFRLQGVELDLHHDDAQRPTIGGVDAARQIQAGTAGYGAQGEELGLAASHRIDEIGPEAVVGPDETGRQTPVAGRARATARVDDIDHRRAGLTRQALQLGINRIGGVGTRSQQARDVRIAGQGQGQGAVFLQFAAQHGGMKGRSRLGLTRQLRLRVATRHFARQEGGENGGAQPCGQRQPKRLSRALARF